LVQCFGFLDMAFIEPFSAFRYDLERIVLSHVATQPYDKISPEMQERYYAASPYNLSRVILGKRHPEDNDTNNVYTRAAAFFAEWRRQRILRQDREPSIYRYVQQFKAPSSVLESSVQFERQGFIALGKIEDYSASVVFRHEQTLAKPKADRLDLLRNTKANFGQLFMLYSDPGSEIDAELASSQPPTMEMRDEYGVLHRVWRIPEAGVIEQVRSKMREKKLIIADGHHRYETALTYRNERRAEAEDSSAHNPRSNQGSRPPAYEFAMMTFVNMDSPGLLILPTHRVVHGLTNFSPDRLRSGASEFFNSVEETDPMLSPERASSILREAGHTGTALLAACRSRIFLLSRSKPAGPALLNVSVRQQALDVVQLHKCLLKNVLGLSEESIRNQTNISYIRDAGEALASVRSGNADLAFLMNPVRIEQMKDIAFAGEVMPQKSTDFYPKLLSGLTIYSLD
jgi:uncharacterized protein (DUF1015 family)